MGIKTGFLQGQLSPHYKAFLSYH